jgi:hypothetical protein
LSAGFSASLNPHITIPLEITSVNVWNASAITDIDPIMNPIKSFKKNINPFTIIEIHP